ncbi:hypothetical protein [Gracilimonas sp.]|uniref:hypothetical protein n=1 Tax=Gracilimonas sp. TaxID=1974203 RepID=UPI002871F50C|nr:hypothetical protein [Gracilimonas sp.]
MAKPSLGLFLLFVFLVGCNSSNEQYGYEQENFDETTKVYEIDTEPEYQIHFDKTAFPKDLKKLKPVNIGGIAADEAGNVFFLDSDKRRILKVDKNGYYQASNGREGNGPGEFIATPKIRVVNDTLFAFAPMLRRITVFSTDSLQVLDTYTPYPKGKKDVQELNGFDLSMIYFTKNAQLLAQFNEPIFSNPAHKSYNADSLFSKFALMNKDGNFLSGVILEQRGKEYLTVKSGCQIKISAAPFLSQPLFITSDDGDIILASSRSFLINVYDFKGTLKNSFFYPLERLKINHEEVLEEQKKAFEAEMMDESLIKIWECVYKKAQKPEYWPVLEEMVVDDNKRLWVETRTNDPNKNTWWVVDMEGTLHAKFDWPVQEEIQLIKGDYLYATKVTNENEELMRYRIELEER